MTGHDTGLATAASMPRTLSSAQTWFMKFAFPVLWVAVFGVFTAVSWPSFTARPDVPHVQVMQWLYAFGWISGLFLIHRRCAPLKRVQLDGDALLVSNYLREERVPLRHLQSVTENVRLNTHPVTLQFRRDTGFGERIVFMPPIRLLGKWVPHPLVPELRALAERAGARLD